MSPKKETKPTRGRPATGKTPKRYFRMSDEDWESIQHAAKTADANVSEFIRETLLKTAKSKRQRKEG